MSTPHFIEDVTPLPHSGQALASELTCAPHSLHLISAIVASHLLIKRPVSEVKAP